MAEQNIVEVIVRNITNGPKVLNSMPPGVLAGGDSTDEPVKMTEAEAASARKTGWFEIDGGSESKATEPGPLDSSVADLTDYLKGINDPDEVQKLIDAETAGKSRAGALKVLEARRDELLAA